jgi:hypothetical protein
VKVAEMGIARRKAKTFPRKRAVAPTEDEIPLPYPSSASVFQTFLRSDYSRTILSNRQSLPEGANGSLPQGRNRVSHSVTSDRQNRREILSPCLSLTVYAVSQMVHGHQKHGADCQDPFLRTAR